MGLPRRLEPPGCGPENMLGIELNPYAAELARVSVWIGDIQWSRTNGFEPARNPVLRPLQTIECRDALLNADGTRAEWPKADVVVGNPPFLGTKRLRSELGDAAVNALYAAYAPTVPQQADLVCYWFHKAWKAILSGSLGRAGLVSTNSIRGGANREVLKAIVRDGRISDAWSDEEWTVEGAAVRVSLVCFDKMVGITARLDGRMVAEIHADLSARNSEGAGTDLTHALLLMENRGVAFMGDTKGGAFDISGDLARQWLALPLNPNGRHNADVLRPWVNGLDLTRRPSGKWIIDFGWVMSETEAALFEAPFRHCLFSVKPERDRNRRDSYRLSWWRHVEPDKECGRPPPVSVA
jgi:type II restriction/modification system DNA methylase subunit YeeA